ncbi:O-antigen ligase family protein [Robiginitalea sp. M366]|uniref:O-antigen ligase family protein n=1 Tax=Robiginitalea aestuariiviva TaxID=3036903 RepID=UPI00240DFC1C|nr:O-antigen ligase family protein [Robiginitalea aestuariiviva]MDG1571470.1 O-antigen ligase family protein [Robiginitalea aestuariiviva]
MIVKKANIIYLFLIIGFAFICILYINKKYSFFSTGFDTIRVELNKTALHKGLPILYAYKNFSADLDFKKVYKFQKANDSTILLEGLDDEKISKFRIYFEYPGKEFKLKKLTFLKDNKELSSLVLSEFFSSENIEVKVDGVFNVLEVNGFIELPYTICNKIPYFRFFLTISLLVIVFLFLLIETNIVNELSKAKTKEYIFIAYLFSIYSAHPLFNILLIISLFFYIKNLDVKSFSSNWINLLFLAFFVVYFLNTLFIRVGEIRDFSMVEKFLPFVFIPLLLSSIRLKESIYYLMVSGLFLSLFLFTFALIDYGITINKEFFSFENFSKFLHPVYVSYLLFLSICYLETRVDYKFKSALQLFLFVALILLGSKLVLIACVALYLAFYISLKRNIKKILAGAFIILLFGVLFKPIQTRFNEILNLHDLSVLNEEYVDSNDPRVNGLSIRILVWKEVFSTFDNWKEYIFGKGVTASNFKELKQRLNNKGLVHHSSYNPHNQFVDTFWKTGAFGLVILLAIPTWAFVVGIKTRNKLLMVFSLFLFVSMLTESVFGRVRGVYFFTTVLLLLTNNNCYNEISHFRNKRRSKLSWRI